MRPTSFLMSLALITWTAQAASTPIDQSTFARRQAASLEPTHQVPTQQIHPPPHEQPLQCTPHLPGT